jgi:hypothetical protein
LGKNGPHAARFVVIPKAGISDEAVGVASVGVPNHGWRAEAGLKFLGAHFWGGFPLSWDDLYK